MIIFQNAFIHRFRACILGITIQEADWNSAHECEKPAWKNNEQLALNDVLILRLSCKFIEQKSNQLLH